MAPALAACLVLAAAVLAAALIRAARRLARQRRDVLADCAGLLDDAESSLGPDRYGRLRGRLRGRRASLVPIAEALAFRRLPQLWIAAAVARDGDGAIEIVRRPTGAEFFVDSEGLPLAFAPPPTWPQDTRIRGTRDAGGLLLDLENLLAAPLADPKVKAVSVSARGVRVVRQAAQGERGAYLLFRDARFRDGKVSRDDAAAALDLARRVAETAEKRTIDEPAAHAA